MVGQPAGCRSHVRFNTSCFCGLPEIEDRQVYRGILLPDLSLACMHRLFRLSSGYAMGLRVLDRRLGTRGGSARRIRRATFGTMEAKTLGGDEACWCLGLIK